MNELVVYTGNELNNLLVFEIGQTDTLVWDTIEYTIVSGIDLCGLTGLNSSISLIGVTPTVELIGEMFSIFIDVAHLRFDGLGVLFQGQFASIKSVASLIGFYSWLNSDSKVLSSLIESDKGELIATANSSNTEISGINQKIDVFVQPNNEC